MNNDRDAKMIGLLFTAVLVLGLTYISFGERLGIKSPPPNDRLSNAYRAK